MCFTVQRALIYLICFHPPKPSVKKPFCFHISYKETEVKLACLMCLSSRSKSVVEIDHVTSAGAHSLSPQLSCWCIGDNSDGIIFYYYFLTLQDSYFRGLSCQFWILPYSSKVKSLEPLLCFQSCWLNSDVIWSCLLFLKLFKPTYGNNSKLKMTLVIPFFLSVIPFNSLWRMISYFTFGWPVCYCKNQTVCEKLAIFLKSWFFFFYYNGKMLFSEVWI